MYRGFSRTGVPPVPWSLAFSGSSICVEYGGSEREGAFFRLRVGRVVRGEAGETGDAQAATPDFGAQLMNQALGGGPGWLLGARPFRRREQTVFGVAAGSLRGD